jgi:hypothetical protein
MQHCPCPFAWSPGNNNRGYVPVLYLPPFANERNAPLYATILGPFDVLTEFGESLLGG